MIISYMTTQGLLRFILVNRIFTRQDYRLGRVGVDRTTNDPYPHYIIFRNYLHYTFFICVKIFTLKNIFAITKILKVKKFTNSLKIIDRRISIYKQTDHRRINLEKCIDIIFEPYT